MASLKTLYLDKATISGNTEEILQRYYSSNNRCIKKHSMCLSKYTSLIELFLQLLHASLFHFPVFASPEQGLGQLHVPWTPGHSVSVYQAAAVP